MDDCWVLATGMCVPGGAEYHRPLHSTPAILQVLTWSIGFYQQVGIVRISWANL